MWPSAGGDDEDRWHFDVYPPDSTMPPGRPDDPVRPRTLRWLAVKRWFADLYGRLHHEAN